MSVNQPINISPPWWWEMTEDARKLFVAVRLNCHPGVRESWPMATIDRLIRIMNKEGEAAFSDAVSRTIAPRMP